MYFGVKDLTVIENACVLRSGYNFRPLRRGWEKAASRTDRGFAQAEAGRFPISRNNTCTCIPLEVNYHLCGRPHTTAVRFLARADKVEPGRVMSKVCGTMKEGLCTTLSENRCQEEVPTRSLREVVACGSDTS